MNILDTYHQLFTTSYIVEGVWPTSVSEMKLEYKDNDTSIMKFRLGLKYQYAYEDREFDFNGDPLGNRHKTLSMNDPLPPIRDPRSQPTGL